MQKQNRVGFVNFIQNYLESQNDEQRFLLNPHLQKQTYTLLHQQQIVQDYLSIQTPYRGLLVFHNVGSGKTLTAISVIHSLEQYKKIFVLTKKSLQTGFKQEIYKFDRIQQQKWKKTGNLVPDSVQNKAQTFKWTIDENGTLFKNLPQDDQLQIKYQFLDDLDNKYQFISYNGIRQPAIHTFNFDNSLIIIDEAHNFISQSINDKQDQPGVQLYNKIIKSANIKILLLTGTPIINQPLELAYFVNLLHGPTTYYTIPYNQKNFEVIQNNKHIDYYQQIFNQKNDKSYITFTLNPPCFVNTPENQIVFDDSLPFGQCDDIRNNFALQSIQNAIPKFLQSLKTKITYPFPFQKEEFEQYFGSLNTGTLLNLDSIKRRTLGIVSYYGYIDENIMPVMKSQFLKVEMSPLQFSKYIEARAFERTFEKKKNKNRDQDPESQGASIYKSFSRMISDFVFPQHIERLFWSEAKKLGYDYPQFQLELSEQIQKLDKEKNMCLNMEQLPQYSPKYYKILQSLLDKNNVGPHLLYTFYRKTEGINIIKMILQVNGFAELKIKKDFYTNQYTLDIPKEDIGKPLYIDFDSNTDQLVLDIFNNKLDDIPLNIKDVLISNYKNQIMQHQDIIQEQNKTVDTVFNMCGDIVKVMLITQGGAEGLNLRNVRFVHVTEPFWNQQVQNQVIGRATRQKSHFDFPLRFRNVDATIYLCTLTQKQIQSDQSIQILDKGISTDEELLRISTNKNNITQQIIEIFKECSIDCYTIKQYNPNQKCYRFPPNFNKNRLIYSQDIDKNINETTYKQSIIQIEIPILYNAKNKPLQRQSFYYDQADNTIFDIDSQQPIGQIVDNKVVISNTEFVIEKLTSLGQQDDFIFDNNNQVLIHKDTNQKFRTFQYIYGIIQQI